MNQAKIILIIEDELDLLELLSDSFKELGLNVILTSTGEDGLKLALTKSPDVILLDLLLPKMGGLMVLKKLRENKESSHIPVIVLSNLSDHSKISEAMELGIYDYLIKSNAKLKDIVDVVRNALKD